MTRRDVAVIMARGLSRRMGHDKGLVRLEPDGPPLVRLIADTYRTLGIPFLVVTLADLGAAYADALGLEDESSVLTAEAGGDTARTLVLARRFLADRGVTHLWAHPVDMPLVEAITLESLLVESRRRPAEVVRPSWKFLPGHPVILPFETVAGFEALAGWREKSVRKLLSGGERPNCTRCVHVEDPGVIQDFDKPDDLPPASPSAPGRGVT